jgi:hypothetical protein
MKNQNFAFTLLMGIATVIVIILVLVSPSKAEEYNLDSNGREIFGYQLIKDINESEYHKKPYNLLDLDKLAYAVAMHETKNCGLNYGSSAVNNCFGIMTWPNGKRRFKHYSNPSESYADFKRIWTAYYKGFPTIAKAKKWSGNDRASAWLRNVNHYYYE